MSILAFILFGFVVGLIARAIMPGRQAMGLLATAAIGMVGSLVGGFIGNLLSGDALLELHPAGIIGSIVGTLLVMFAVGFSGRRRAFA